MSRKNIVKLVLCNHLLHQQFYDGLATNSSCPNCRTAIEDTNLLTRRVNNKYTEQDRARIVQCANQGNYWVELAASLNIRYKTAYRLVTSGTTAPSRRGGNRPKALTQDHVDTILGWIEAEWDITLKMIQERLLRELHVTVSVRTIGNYLENQLYTLKQTHQASVNMNIMKNKRKRAVYVQKLQDYLRAGKQIVWVDETNFNLFCRRSRGRAKRGRRATQVFPASRGPNVHLIGAISSSSVVWMERQRGSFDSQRAKQFIQTVINQWEALGNNANDLVIIFDNAPSHSKIEEAVQGTGAIALRLGPYSPMLNPIENIWSKIKLEVKNNIRVPEVTPPGVTQQRIVYLEEAMTTPSGLQALRIVPEQWRTRLAFMAMLFN